MLAAWYTAPGSVRDSNQDAVLVGGSAYGTLGSPCVAEFRDSDMVAVADGVGGYLGGDEASRVLLRHLSRYRAQADPDSAQREVRRLVRSASGEMGRIAALDPALGGMSAAVAGVFAWDGGLTAFNCGDCRVYRLERASLAKLTHDHSQVQMLADAGEIDEEEMRTHPRKHIITSSVGPDPADTYLFFRAIEDAPPARLLVCSDGVWEALPLDELEHLASLPLGEAAVYMAEALEQACASDNVSFVIIVV
jgi:serine/threonine protein phosphatase PrpC